MTQLLCLFSSGLLADAFTNHQSGFFPNVREMSLEISSTLQTYLLMLLILQMFDASNCALDHLCISHLQLFGSSEPR